MKLAFILASSAALQPPHVVVVGGGVGGLATAADSRSAAPASPCSKRTIKSAVASANTAWQQHRWETGASLLLLPDVYRDALTAAGAAQLDIKRVAPAYAVWYEKYADRGPVILGGDRASCDGAWSSKRQAALSALRSTGRRRASTCGPAGPYLLRRIFLPHHSSD